MPRIKMEGRAKHLLRHIILRLRRTPLCSFSHPLSLLSTRDEYVKLSDRVRSSVLSERGCFCCGGLCSHPCTMTANACVSQCHAGSTPHQWTIVRPCTSSRRICSAVGLPARRYSSAFVFKGVDLARGGSRGTQASGGRGAVVCGLGDFVGGDLLGFDLDKWSNDVEEFGSIAVYAPPEGGYEGRYATRLRREGYHFLNLSARGLGDLEAYLTKIHGVRPAHLGKQAIARFYLPPEVDHRLSLIPPNSKGLVVWIIEAKVLSKTELQYLALLPALRPKVKVIAEVGTWRSYRWKPLKEVAGLPMAKGIEDETAPIKIVSETETAQKSPTRVGP